MQRSSRLKWFVRNNKQQFLIMKTQKIKHILFLLISLSAFLQSCDDFTEEERLTPLRGEITDTAPITKIQNEQALLLEDFTGWNCPNCPEGTEILKSLKQIYGDKIVIAAIHQGAFAKPSNKNDNLDLRTEYGNELGGRFNITNWPTLVINRDVIPSGRGEWTNKVAELFASTPHLLNLSLGTKQIEGRTIVSVRAEAVEDISDNLIITLYITESDIEGKQNDNGTLSEGYLFQHVLRNNPLVGLPLTTNAMKQGEKIEKSYLLETNGLNQEHCSVVVMIAKASDGKVMQTNEIEIK